MEMELEMETDTGAASANCLTDRKGLWIKSAMAFAVAILLLAGTLAAADAPPVPLNGSVGFSSGAVTPIGAGDLLEMNVLQTPELSGKLRVSNSGDVLLPLVGTVHVAGLTVGEAQSLIRRKLKDGDFMKDPQVTVFISEYATQGVSVLGEVHKPGIYPAFGSHRLLDYLSLAEGLTLLAGPQITITRAGHPENPETVRVTAGATPQPEANPEIRPGDTIFVERTGVIYVVGDVARPGGFPMDHNGHLSVLQAIALAQGLNGTAAKSASVLIRTTPAGKKEISLNLKKVLAAKAADLELEDNDILFIPTSAAKGAWKDITTVLPTAAAASIYRLP